MDGVTSTGQWVSPGVFLLTPSGPGRTFSSASVAAGGRGQPAATQTCAPAATEDHPDDLDVSADRQRAALDAMQVELADDARGYARRIRLLLELSRAAGPGEQFTELEMAGSWHISQLTAAAWALDAERFETCLPLTLALLDEGALSVAHAKVLLHRTRHCTEDVTRAVEQEVLPVGATLCPSDLRRRVDRAVLRTESGQQDPAAAEQRRAEAVARRRTFARPELDGMGLAGAVLTAEQLVCWQHGMDLLERRERAADRDAGVERSAEQRRADLFAALPALVLAGTAQDRLAGGSGGCPCGRTADTGCCLASVLGAVTPAEQDAGEAVLAWEPGGSLGGTSTADEVLAAASRGRPLTCPAAPLAPPTPRPTSIPTPSLGPLTPWTLDHAQVAATIVLNVHVPVATVLDLSREPATLDRYGPVSAEHVRLVRPRLHRRVLVDSRTGVPLAVDDRPTAVASDPAGRRGQLLAMLRVEVVTDREEPQHDPSAPLARLVDLRDVHCCGPGCSSTRTDRDHLVPHPLGPTCASNLGRLSRRCHRAKHGGWTLVRHPDGSSSWTSPLGRRYDRQGPHTPPPRITSWDLPALRPEPQAPVEENDEPWAEVLRSRTEPEVQPVVRQDEDEPPF